VLVADDGPDARVDALTGIPNRRAMDEELKVLLARAARDEHDVAVVLVDVDNFKDYNDGYGHLAGDELLSSLGMTLKDVLRDSDTVYRFGGEEFLAVLPDQDTESATTAAERLRRAVRDLEVDHPEGGLVTISAGVATVRRGEMAAELLARADRALYAAKAAGRDCVRAADGDRATV
jgi:diguanylate cyclase (GGDEF)-like protein